MARASAGLGARDWLAELETGAEAGVAAREPRGLSGRAAMRAAIKATAGRLGVGTMAWVGNAVVVDGSRQAKGGLRA